MSPHARRLLRAATAGLLVLLYTTASCRLTAALSAAQTTATLSFLQCFPSEIDYLRTRWTGTDYCSWEGISCDANGLVSVNLSGKGLTGYMPQIEDNIDGSLIMVVSIDMSNNPDWDDEFEDDWAALKNLQDLDMSSTALHGYIPDAWNGMTALRTLKIANTYACKGLPNWNIATLTTVDLSNNRMGGALANAWGAMPSLQSVTLTGNSFCGCVPTTWTSAVLQAAASAIGGNLVAASCATSNVCGSQASSCAARDFGSGPEKTTATVVVLLLSMVLMGVWM